MSANGKTERTTAEELLYQCIRELSFVQSVENCGSGLCATPAGEELIREGMELLGVRELEWHTLEGQRKAEARQEA